MDLKDLTDYISVSYTSVWASLGYTSMMKSTINLLLTSSLATPSTINMVPIASEFDNINNLIAADIFNVNTK